MLTSGVGAAAGKGTREGANGAAVLAEAFAAGGQGAVPQRDADLLHLWTVFQHALAGTLAHSALLNFVITININISLCRVVVAQVSIHGCAWLLCFGGGCTSNLASPSENTVSGFCDRGKLVVRCPSKQARPRWRRWRR